MNLPNEVLIGPHQIQIQPLTTAEALAGGIHGSFSEIESIIRINTERPSSCVLETLMHEITHGIWAVYKIPEEVQEEHAVSVLGVALVQVFKDNKQLLKLLGR